MMSDAATAEARGRAFTFGLNPYGLTYYLGLQGAGGARANPRGIGLEGFIGVAQELGARAIELFDPWLRALNDHELAALGERLRALGMIPIVSSGMMMGPFESALRSARALDAKVIRFGLTTVLCGDRHALGAGWAELAAKVGAALAEYGPRAADEGRVLAIENHQDFGSDELVAFCEASRGVGITLDMGNTFPVGEAPLAFTERVAPHVRHVHLKDYRVQFTDEGYRLVRCAIGDGAVPIAEMLDIVSAHHKGWRRCWSRGPWRRAMCAGSIRNGGISTRRRRRPPSRPASPPRERTVCPTTPITARPGRRARTARSSTTNSP